MQVALVRRQPKRRCLIPRRPHPDLEYFFGRFQRTDIETKDNAGPELADLEQLVWSQHRQ
jgi:hypothetical protein